MAYYSGTVNLLEDSLIALHKAGFSKMKVVVSHGNSPFTSSGISFTVECDK